MAEEVREEVEVTYHKSNHFRVMLAEGCFGGVTPRGLISCSFWNERAALPKRGRLHVVNGVPQAEDFTDVLPGIVRELEATVVMDVNSAISYYVWLREKLEVVRKGLNIGDDDWVRMLGEKNEKI